MQAQTDSVCVCDGHMYVRASGPTGEHGVFDDGKVELEAVEDGAVVLGDIVALPQRGSDARAIIVAL